MRANISRTEIGLKSEINFFAELRIVPVIKIGPLTAS